jgi:hypothetical protein
MRRLSSLLLLPGILGLATVPALSQDSIVAMCEMAAKAAPEQSEHCECALTALQSQIGGDEFAMYANVGTLYFENLGKGLARSDAWDVAARTVGEGQGMALVDVLQVTNPIGRLHAQALKDCAG